MFHIQVFDNLSPNALRQFSADRYHVATDITEPDVILVRSHKLHDYAFPANIKAVGRAGAGTDNIPVDKLTAMGIPVFFAPGANANAVKELVLAAMLMGYRNLHKAQMFLNGLTQHDNPSLNQHIESNKKTFVGHEISGKTLGVIGLGNIGVKVANAAQALGMNVLACDPDMTLSNALALMPSVEKVNDMNELLMQSDIVTLHVPLSEHTTDLINQGNIDKLRPDCLLLNFSRQKVVNEEAILQRLHTHKAMGYITDFPTSALASLDNVLSFPHLGASTQEAESNCAEMVVRNVRQYLEHGIIERSVNFPDIALPALADGCHRFMVVNRNVPGAIGSITQTLSQRGYNIEKMVNNSRADVAVNLIDVSGPKPMPQLTQDFAGIDCVLRLHVLN